MLEMQAAPQTRQLVTSQPLLAAAYRSQSAVAALNFYNAETLIAHVRAANAQRASIILQTTESTIKYLGLGLVVAMARSASAELEKPAALHLDHGGSYELARRCIEAGYTSVMFDGSTLPFAENCEQTRQVVELAHAHGVTVEGELGHVAHNDETEAAEIENFYTRPEDALRFVAETGVDALAIAIGTAHGFYRGMVQLDFERLDRIREAVGERVALVLHGGSGVPDDLLRQAVAHGISKINFGTELKDAFTRAVKTTLAETDEIDLRKTFAPAISAVQQMAEAKIKICRAAI